MRRLDSLEAWRQGRDLAREAYRQTLSGPLAVDMELIGPQVGKEIVATCDREIGLLIGLLRKLGTGR